MVGLLASAGSGTDAGRSPAASVPVSLLVLLLGPGSSTTSMVGGSSGSSLLPFLQEERSRLPDSSSEKFPSRTVGSRMARRILLSNLSSLFILSQRRALLCHNFTNATWDFDCMRQRRVITKFRIGGLIQEKNAHYCKSLKFDSSLHWLMQKQLPMLSTFKDACSFKTGGVAASQPEIGKLHHGQMFWFWIELSGHLWKER